MKISDETTAEEDIAVWRSKAPKEQLKLIRLAIETLELNQMYFLLDLHQFLAHQGLAKST